MKNLSEFLKESLNESSMILESKSTITDFLCWHFNLDSIEELTFEMFSKEDFDANVLNKKFDGDLQAMYNYIMDFVKSNKLITINCKRAGSTEMKTEIKAGKITFRVTSIDKEKPWEPEFVFTKALPLEKNILTYENQVHFEKWATNRLNDEGYLTRDIKNSYNFRRSGGFIGFDHIQAYDTFGNEQTNVPGLIADETLNYGQAYDILVDYLKKQKYIK